MSLSLDTSALLKLYVDEPLTRELHACLAAREMPCSTMSST